MRKTIIFAAVAALTMLSSCQKEVASEQSSDELTFTASIVDQSTRTTIDTDANSETKGKVSWEVGDEITISDGTNEAVYYIKSKSDIAADGTASFTYKSGSRLSSSATEYTATYGHLYAGQSYSATAGKLPMSGESDSSGKTKLNFTVTCGLLKLNLTASAKESDKTISNIFVQGSYGTEYLGCNDESISSAKDFYIALHAGEYSTITFTNGKGHICYKISKSPMMISANEIKTLTFTDLIFDDKLPGKFSVAPGKQVQFSRGNIQAKRSANGAVIANGDGNSRWDFDFATGQGYFIGSDNITGTSLGNVIDLFCWSSNDSGAYLYGISVDEGDNYGTSGDFNDWGKTIDNDGTWRTLSSGEWVYMLFERIVNGGTGLGNSYLPATLYDDADREYISGLIIYPDNYTYQKTQSWYDILVEWSEMEDLGCVFLPKAGNRFGWDVTTSEFSYWSSDLKTLILFGSEVETTTGYRTCGSSVRLVSDTPVYYGNLNGGAANMEWGDDDSNNWE